MAKNKFHGIDDTFIARNLQGHTTEEQVTAARDERFVPKKTRRSK